MIYIRDYDFRPCRPAKIIADSERRAGKPYQRSSIMKDIRHSKTFLIIVFPAFFVLILSVPSYAELSVESYCQLALGIEQQEVGYLNGLFALTRKYCEDPNYLRLYCNEPNSFIQQKLVMQAEFDKAKETLFASFHTTTEEYTAFSNANSEAIEQYLDNDPNTAQMLDNLLGQINNLQKELKIPSYCLLSIAVNRQEIKNLSELIALARQYSSDPNAFLEQEQLKQEKFNKANGILFSAFSTTSDEYLMFMGKNSVAVEQYLISQPHIRQSIDKLSSQLYTRLKEYEALRQSIIKVPAR
jgi:hypothetical protein